MPDGQNLTTRKVTVKIEDPKLIGHEKTKETTGPVEVFHSQEVSEKVIIPKGQLKNVPIVTANPDAPVDGLAQAEKTDEQIENLNKLKEAKMFMKTEQGAKLSQSMFNQECNLSDGQRKWLKKQGVDPDAFVQEWNKANPNSANNKTHNAEAAKEQKEEMGTLANTHLGSGKDREESPSVNEKLKDTRTFFQKFTKIKDKQKVKADAQHGFETATKVNVHSSTEKRGDTIKRVVGDDIARAGDEYLEAYEAKSDGKKRRTFKEIDENGNIVKTKVVYNKDGSVKKVVTKGKSDGKLVVKEAKDGDITVKGNLNSNFLKEESAGLNERTIEDITILKEVVSEKTKDTYLQNKTVTIHEKEECDPVVVVPKEPIKGGLVFDVVNSKTTGGMGSVDGRTIRTEFKDHGAAKMAEAYCSYNNENVPLRAKTEWGENPASMANAYNGKHIAESLINDPDTKKVNEKALAEFITELRKQGCTDALMGVKEAIMGHNDNVTKDGGFKNGTVNEKVSENEMAIEWLINIPQSHVERV